MEQAADQVPAGRRPWWRAALVAATVFAVLAAGAAIAYRVLAPAEVITEATAGYPEPASREPVPGVIGTLAAAPIMVDGRLRVYATKRQVRADAPVDARTQRSPFWSYRRWPEQLVGVVTVGATVVSRWSDGRLVALDGRTGRVAWRADGPMPASGSDEYIGRRTGAATVYTPAGLYTAGQVVVAHGAAGTLALAARDGRELWRLPAAAAGCAEKAFTTVAGRFAVFDRCSGEPRLRFHDAATGRAAGHWQGWSEAPTDVVPVGCRLGRSECAGLRSASAPAISGGSAPATGPAPSGGAAGTDRGWLLRGPVPVPAAGLGQPDSWLVAAPDADDLVVAPRADGRLAARHAGTGAELWVWPPAGAPARDGARVIATQPGRVHLLTADFWLVTVDAVTGAELSGFRFTYGKERTGWTAGHAYASNGFLLLERLAADADPAAPDDQYYFIAQPTLLAGT